MRKMKDSGIKWVGEIPEDWYINRIKSLLIERKETNRPVKTENILSLTNDRGVIPYEEKGAVGNKSKDDITAYKLAYPNDIVFNSMNAIIGSIALSDYYGAVSPVYYMLYLRNKEDSIKYYNYIFQTNEFQNNLRGYGNGIMEIRMRIPMINLNNLLLPTPPSDEQQKIACFLDEKVGKVDELISLQEKEIEKLNEYKKSLITKAVTKGLDPNAKMKDSGIEWVGEIPENWTVLRLKNIGETRSGIANKKPGDFGFGYPFVTYKNVYSNFVLDVNTDEKVNSTLQDRKIYNIKYGDVFFTGSSETIDELGLSSVALQDFENAVFNGFTIRFRPNSLDGYNPEYMKYLFRSEVARGYLSSYDNSITRSNLSQSRLKDLVIVLPKEKEQKKIAGFLDEKTEQINSLIKIKQQKMEKLKEYKKSLIYEYVTGKKQVI